MATTTRRNEGGRYSSQAGSAWYQAIEEANIQAVEDAERTLTTALAHQVGNAVAAMPEAAARIQRAANLVQSRNVWALTGGSYLVASQHDPKGAYLVQRHPLRCECQDSKAGHLCKHALAVGLTVKMGDAYQPRDS